ncbi:MAG TPA: hypothetical protein EYO37_02665 [Nitrospina sp.]|nr:hypothetical protein [Nitrospina sp.]
MKIDINKRYVEEEEVRVNDAPYRAYYDCLAEAFDFSTVDSVCDVGCATGHLLYFLKKHKNVKVKGYEYFSFHKDSEYCKEEIRDFIEVRDMRDPLPEDTEKYSLVNCSEVGEHLDPEYASTLVENTKKLSDKYIVFTWAYRGDPSHKPKEMIQHLNPLTLSEYTKLMEDHGLKYNDEITNKFLAASLKTPDFYFWWRESLRVFEI